MGMMIAGLAIWVLVHLFPSVLAPTRNRLAERLGGAYQGLFALTILAGLLLIIFGWRSTIPEPVYWPPAGLRHAAMGLALLSFLLMAAANIPGSRVHRVLRHPQLSGVFLWSVAHLLANGDSRSVLVFGTIGAWALLSMLTINRRDGAWQKPAPASGWRAEIIVVVSGLAVSAVVVYFHAYLSGVALID